MQQAAAKYKSIFALPSLLLAAYFVLNNYLQFGYMIESRQFIVLTGICLLTPVLLFLVLQLFLRNAEKAGLISLITCLYIFFTAPLHTSFRVWVWYSNTISFSLFLAATTILYLLLIRKTVQAKIRLYGKLLQYLLFLPLVLAGWDLLSTGLKLKKREFSFNLSESPRLIPTKLQPLSKTNILYVVFDMHGGTSTIKKQLHFNNHLLDTLLVHAGFRVWSNAFSPTNYTPTTLASVFQMQPLQKRSTGQTLTIRTMYEGGYLSKYNPLTPFLKQQGYNVHNLGVIPLAQKSFGIKHEENWGNPSRIITNQILPIYIFNTYRWAFAKLSSERVYSKSRKIHTEDIRTTKLVLDSLHKIFTAPVSKAPAFVYAHFFIPHEPFKFDSSGNVLPWSKHMYFNGTINQYYIDQIIYARKLMQMIIRESRKNSDTRWAIIFQGDHGIRDHKNGSKPEDICHVLHAVHLPGTNLKPGIDSMPETTVNTFRVVMNHLFNQQLPLLPVNYRQYEYVFE